MEIFLNLFILLPLLGLIISLFIPADKEAILSRIAFTTAGIQAVSIVAFITYWIYNGHPNLNIKEINVYSNEHFNFFLDLFFDKVTAVYLLVGSLLTFLVTSYSQYYLHREKGYKRFFNTILFFYTGYNIVVLSGNLETLFIGWEILGVASFLLIAFYRDRYLPVKNAVKVFSIYRIADVGLILAMWMSHHLFHENITFAELLDYNVIERILENHQQMGIFISLMIVLASIVKSAQLPFSSWLSRAMEGPTPSSAIFYGSLSVHIGVFLLLRMMPLWEHQPVIRILIAVIGISTSLVTTGIARVQSSIKSQIAYASIAQIGLIYVEVALGWDTLALVHFAGNAFLRTYQLLVSPSVVSYLIREQFYEFTPESSNIEHKYPNKLQYTLYILSLKEWGLDGFLTNYLFLPLKKVGSMFQKIPLYVIAVLFVIGVIGVFNKQYLSTNVADIAAFVCAGIALVTVLQSFTERKNVYVSWILILFNHFWITLSISYNESIQMSYLVLYLGGIVASGILGILCLESLKSKNEKIGLDTFYGLAKEYPTIGLVFLVACLGLSGFPITPTFIGEDIAFSFIHEDQFLLAFITALSLIIDGICIMRIYAKLFLGTSPKKIYESGFRSS